MFQKLIIVGNVGKEPEMRYTPSGKAVTSFSLATNRSFKGADGEQKKETAWFRITVWEKQAETVSQYVHKGSKVLVEGRLTVDPATGGPKIFTRTDGSSGASFDVTAETVRFLDSKSASTEEAEPVDETSIPF
jgi:single-strand DNA-binding protein